MIYEKIGGFEVISKLVDDFYQTMATDPYARDCFATHKGRDLSDSAEKLKAFLSGWTGGPQLYLEKYGHPRLRMRHLLFKTGRNEGEQWLYCMHKALDKSPISPELKKSLMDSFKTVVEMLTEGRA